VDGSAEKPSILYLVIAGLANGRLWILQDGPVWWGRGLTKPCVVCRLRIATYDIQFDVPGPRGALPTHADCYSVWLAQSDTLRMDTM